MEMEKIEDKLEQNAKDIGKLTNNMIELSIMVKGMETRHADGMTAVQQVMQNIQKLLEKDIETLRAQMGELKGDYRTLKHDLNNVINVANRVPDFIKELTTAIAKVDSLEKWQTTTVTTVQTSSAWIKILWIVGTSTVGAGIFGAVIALVLKLIGGIDVAITPVN